MTSAQLVAYLLIGAFIVLFIAAAVSWGFAAFYMIKTMTRYHPERTWGKYVPVSLFMPWFFTAEGNVYRIKLLKAGGLFTFLVALGIAFGFFTDTLKTGANKPVDASASVMSSNPTPHADARDVPTPDGVSGARAGGRER
jgi:hypothetical protein